MSNEYFSVNRLASSVAQKYPDSLYIVVYFDKFYNSDFNRVNIIPLKIVCVNKQKQFKSIDDLFPNIRYVSAPNYIVKNFKKDLLAKLVIEVKETKNKVEDFTFHKIQVYYVFNKDLHEKLNPFCSQFDKDIIELDIDPDMI